MANTIPTILVLMLACLLALSAALPSVLNQIMFAQADPNAPRTLLGKSYRRCSESKPCPPSCWIRSLTDRNDSDTRGEGETPTANGGCNQKMMAKGEPHAQRPLPLPLVLNASPESEQTRLRFVKSKRPWRYSPCPDGVRVSNRARSDGTMLEDDDAQRVQPAIDSEAPKGKTASRQVSVPVERLKRLYGRGEWKSRLLEEY